MTDKTPKPRPWRTLMPIKSLREPPPTVAVVRLDGFIGRMGGFRQGLSLAGLAPTLEKAFSLRELTAVALAINSPGGSPVQSSLIAGRIRALAKEKEVAVHAFCEDVAASGGYWLACAADEIWADPASIVGSIGVVSGGFGFPELLKRFGIERRLHTAGSHKARLDPFSPEKKDDVKHLKSIQKDLHETFKAMVRERRGDRLTGKEEVLFSGDFWTAPKALDMGLIDGLGDLRTVMREHYGEKVRLKPVGARRPWWRRMGSRTGAPDWAGDLIAALEERLYWSRFGL